MKTTPVSRRHFLGSYWMLLLWTLTAFRLGAAESNLDWHLGAAAWSFNKFTFFEAVEKTAGLGLRYIEAFEGQPVAKDLEAKMGADLSNEVIGKILDKLAASQVTLTSLYIHKLPAEPAACRRAFETARKLKIQFLVSEPEPEALDVIEKLCEEFKINVAIHNHREGVSRYWHPREALKACAGRSWRLGVCADIGHWQRSGIEPTEGIKLLGDRLISVHVKDLDQTNPDGHDVPWGMGKGNIAALLREVRRSGVVPARFTIEYEYHFEDNTAEMGQCADYFKKVVREISAASSETHPLTVGWAQADITPPKPVALIGQLTKRVSQGVKDPLTATVLALETRSGDSSVEQAIMVSCDLLWVRKDLQDRLRARLSARLPEFNARKLFLNATHTHTAPDVVDGAFGPLYDTSDEPGVMKPSAYAEWLLDRVTSAALEAWQSRQPAGLSWGLAYAETGLNRRVHYLDGTTQMYGVSATNTFDGLEAGADDAVKILYFWDSSQKLTGVAINLPCTAQETEHLNEVSADFWHDIRVELRRRHGQDLFVLPQCSAAGDLSPHPVLRKQAEERMLEWRQTTRRQEIARRVAEAADDALPVARQHIQSRLVFNHRILRFELPRQGASFEPFYQTDAPNPVECHLLRLGEVVVATNPFELYLDYGARIEARSKAPLTMLVQLSCQHTGYLPTARAVRGGGYSADKFVVGPEGGQILVEETVRAINELWP